MTDAQNCRRYRQTARTSAKEVAYYGTCALAFELATPESLHLGWSGMVAQPVVLLSGSYSGTEETEFASRLGSFGLPSSWAD
jgi:hypothetical protein